MLRLGVTGTDTAVGKTVIAAASVAWFRARGLSVAAMKPVETGGRRVDAEILREANGGQDSLDDVCPVHFAEAIAPYAATFKSGSAVDVSRLDAAFARLTAGRDVAVVEGAGGLLVPITRGASFASLFEMWNLDLIIVAANRLGVLNHTLLTVDAARAHGLDIAGVVLNSIQVDAADVSVESNMDVLHELLTDIPLIAFPRLDALDPKTIAAATESSGLARLLESNWFEADKLSKPKAVPRTIPPINQNATAP
jgi:dethiobiotin synthetase